MSHDPPLLDRVRKLLALATSPNIHEATAAAALAQTLIARHRLQTWLDADQTVADDPEPIEDARDTPLEASKRLRTWKTVLANALAEANGCFAYTLDRGTDRALVLVGRARDRAAVGALWTWLVTRIEWLSATLGAGQDRQWHEAFRVGCVTALADRLSGVAADVRGECSAAALVRVDPVARAQRDALERFMAERFKLGKSRGVRVDADAWEAGRQAAATLPLGPQARTALHRRRR